MIDHILTFALLVGPRPRQASASCVAALDSMVAVLRHDYAGFRDGVGGHEAAFAALIDSVRVVAKTSDDYTVCISQGLKRVTHFFRDGHLMVWQASAPTQPVAGPSPGRTSIPADDPDRPSLRFLDDSTAVLRLPDFTETYKPLIDGLIATNLFALTAKPFLIVDLSGNWGGYTRAYRRVSDLLYTHPIHFDGQDVWASEANVAFYRSFLTVSEISEDDKALFRVLIPRMESHLGQFVELSPATVERRDTIYAMPRRVAVLVDHHCASTCEDFVFEARQSRKVTVLGSENTAGADDYGNVRSVWLPGGGRMRVPTLQ